MSGWQNRAASQRLLDDQQVEGYPFLYWVNDPGSIAPRPETGGWALLSDSADRLDNYPRGADPVEIHFNNGKTEDGFYARDVTIAPVVSRFTWFSHDENARRDVFHTSYQPGDRGKLQVLCYIKAERGGFMGPVFLTMKGTVTKEMFEALRTHRAVVARATRNSAAAALFWLGVGSGPLVQRGSGNLTSMAAPIVHSHEQHDPTEFDPDFAYVGDELAGEIESHYDEFKVWADAWKQPRRVAENEEQPIETAVPARNDAAAWVANPPQTQNDAPARREAPSQAPDTKRRPIPQESAADMGEARLAWSSAWNALKGAGVVVGFLDNSWDTAQINHAANMMDAALDDLPIKGTQAVSDSLAIALARLGSAPPKQTYTGMLKEKGAIPDQDIPF